MAGLWGLRTAAKKVGVQVEKTADGGIYVGPTPEVRHFEREKISKGASIIGAGIKLWNHFTKGDPLSGNSTDDGVRHNQFERDTHYYQDQKAPDVRITTPFSNGQISTGPQYNPNAPVLPYNSSTTTAQDRASRNPLDSAPVTMDTPSEDILTKNVTGAPQGQVTVTDLPPPPPPPPPTAEEMNAPPPAAAAPAPKKFDTISGISEGRQSTTTLLNELSAQGYTMTRVGQGNEATYVAFKDGKIAGGIAVSGKDNEHGTFINDHDGLETRLARSHKTIEGVETAMASASGISLAKPTADAEFAPAFAPAFKAPTGGTPT